MNWFIKKASRVPLSLFPLSFSAFVDSDKGDSLCLPWDQMYPGSRQDANPWKPLCSYCYRTLKLHLAAFHIGSRMQKVSANTENAAKFHFRFLAQLYHFVLWPCALTKFRNKSLSLLCVAGRLVSCMQITWV